MRVVTDKIGYLFSDSSLSLWIMTAEVNGAGLAMTEDQGVSWGKSRSVFFILYIVLNYGYVI